MSVPRTSSATERWPKPPRGRYVSYEAARSGNRERNRIVGYLMLTGAKIQDDERRGAVLDLAQEILCGRHWEDDYG